MKKVGTLPIFYKGYCQLSSNARCFQQAVSLLSIVSNPGAIAAFPLQPKYSKEIQSFLCSTTVLKFNVDALKRILEGVHSKVIIT